MDFLPDQLGRHFALDIDGCHTGVAVVYPTSRRLLHTKDGDAGTGWIVDRGAP